METYFQAGFIKNSPVSDLAVCLNVPSYRCPICGEHQITNYYNYPDRDARLVLDENQIARLGPKIRIRSSDSEIIDIVQKLRRTFHVPVTAGTIFGPTRLKVTSRPKDDFYVLIQHAGLFCRRPAIQKLLDCNINLKYVPTPMNGKYGDMADYVEIIVPVMGHNQLPETKTFCSECYRYSPGETFDTVLLPPTWQESEFPFFKTIEKGVIVFTKSFIDLINELNLKGFILGKTLLPVRVAVQI